MIHVFCQLNNTTIKSNYLMRRIEFILKNATQKWLKYFFQVDAANEFWAIKIYRSHVYKLDFSVYNDHYCYLRMRQEITKNSEMYSRLKNIVIDSIFFFDSESSLFDVKNETFFEHFVNDNVDEANSFEHLISFLHNYYFSRLVWVQLTLNSKKCKFFVFKIQILSHQRDAFEIRLFNDKLKTFRKWSAFTTKEKLKRFLYMLLFLKNYISKRADKSTFLKSAIIEKVTISVRNDKKRISRKIKNFQWTSKHQKVFDDVRKTVTKNVYFEEDDNFQWYLTTDVSKTEAKKVFFQLSNHSFEILLSKKIKDFLKIVMFLFF